MKYYSEKIGKLITQLSMLPGIGQKTAERLAYHIVKLPKERSAALADAIKDASDNVKQCKICYATCDDDICPVCSSKNRNHKIIMVVENDDDLAQFERSGAYDGVYHVLQGAIKPAGGIGPNDIRLRELINRLRDDVEEVILATSSSIEGETTALYISRLVKPTGIKVTKLASGIPVGSDFNTLDSVTLERALKGRGEA